ncbi:hypothetical protein [Alteromonas oceanisediminis]|uniref:hypothetical protein n=1 Tax=Alteromonas oceanisediminis TaxID=2836180 RepID=UPI001BDB3D91|nr:hypothetical protein [Alteromonas oceanisediminis]MBT0585288.1 hypothetical protein [Alteromonas oceanisediminis]
MKLRLVVGVLITLCFSANATQTSNQQSLKPANIGIVADRLAEKSVSDIITLAMRLQLECQQVSDEDVCGGVNSILAVLDERIESLPASYSKVSLAFLSGLMDGVKNANRDMLSRLHRTE